MVVKRVGASHHVKQVTMSTLTDFMQRECMVRAMPELRPSQGYGTDRRRDAVSQSPVERASTPSAGAVSLLEVPGTELRGNVGGGALAFDCCDRQNRQCRHRHLPKVRRVRIR